MVRTKPHAAVHMCKSFAEYVPACVVPWLVWPDLCALTRAGLTAPREALSLAAGSGTWAGMGAALGCFLFSCVTLVLWREQLRRSMGTGLCAPLMSGSLGLWVPPRPLQP